MKNLVCLLFVVSIALPLQAQVRPAATYDEEDLVTAIFGKNKESLMNDYLHISPVESRNFQTALFEYESEKKPWYSERMALLKMYNEEFSSLDERKMNSLSRQLINNDLEFGRLQMRYFRRMNKLLGATRAAQFFQLDSYFEQSTRAYVQHQLPFIKELESDKNVRM
ncbi:hypothetical protein [Chitinophaga vietnamensis]|uniref:hypothetical protein n=1 Tax=Chitinophaga vietnamensis TaxID=2593957 RepID=UPI0011784F71|nr:hypothetical protein [Chitinophaga vietnamensis]